jgi:hypothetical protein
MFLFFFILFSFCFFHVFQLELGKDLKHLFLLVYEEINHTL